MKPVILTPHYRDGVIFAKARLGLAAAQVDVVTDPGRLRGRNLAEVRVYFLEGRWSREGHRLNMIEFARSRGAKLEVRSL